jgi:uncharacterized protein (TIGR02284 family)
MEQNMMEVINDLIQINNDRIEGYEKALQQTDREDADLKAIFTELAGDSRKNIAALKEYIKTTDNTDETTLRGKIYRVWMDVKATFVGRDRKAILASCEFGEEAAQRAYQLAMENTDLPEDLRKIISYQKADLKTSLDAIQQLNRMQTENSQ